MARSDYNPDFGPDEPRPSDRPVEEAARNRKRRESRRCWICGSLEPNPHARNCLNGVLEGNRET